MDVSGFLRTMIGDGSELVEELMRFRPEGLTANAWAVKAGVSRTIWADLKRHGNPSRRTLEKLLEAAGSSLAEFEALRIGPESSGHGGRADALAEQVGLFRGAELPPLPLIASYQLADRSGDECRLDSMRVVPNEVIERVERPKSLARDGNAYAVTMAGGAMWPRFRPGRRIAISPASTIQEGDDVLIILRRMPVGTGRFALVGELVRKTPDAVYLRQFSPDRTDEISIEEIASAHKVLGELI